MARPAIGRQDVPFNCSTVVSTRGNAPTARRYRNKVKQIDFDEARRFLHALGKPAGTIRLRAFYHALNPKKANDAGRKGAPSRSVMQQWQDEGRGVYVVINDGGDKDAEITTCRAFFCEWDDRPTEWQLTAWKEYHRLPIERKAEA